MKMSDQEIIEQYQRAADKYAATRNLAKQNGCQPGDIFAMLRERGIIGNYGKPATAPAPADAKAELKQGEWTQAEVDRIVQMRNDNTPWKEIAAALNRAEKCVQAKFYALAPAKLKDKTDEVKAAPAKLAKPSTHNGLHAVYSDIVAFISDEFPGAELLVSSVNESSGFIGIEYKHDGQCCEMHFQLKEATK